MDVDQSPISVVIVTKNEERRLGACLKALREHFSDLWVVDSSSADRTNEIARSFGARVVDFKWDGKYPKKYGWCLAHLDGAADWILFIDADEIMGGALADEIKALDLSAAGYFIKARYRVDGYVLKHGLVNNKLCLMNKTKMKFPIIHDLDIDGMGEIEGHYQPVLKAGFEGEDIGQLENSLIHDAAIEGRDWAQKHARYARWEAAMDKRGAWPKENDMKRRILKMIFRALPFRKAAAFVHCYIFKLGFLDGALGYKFARSRYRYYRMVGDLKRQ